MIHNVKVFADGSRMTFEVITEVGKCKCRVFLDITRERKTPELNITEIEILGHSYDSTDSVHIEGARRLINTVRDFCDCSGWLLSTVLGKK